MHLKRIDYIIDKAGSILRTPSRFGQAVDRRKHGGKNTKQLIHPGQEL